MISFNRENVEKCVNSVSLLLIKVRENINSVNEMVDSLYSQKNNQKIEELISSFSGRKRKSSDDENIRKPSYLNKISTLKNLKIKIPKKEQEKIFDKEYSISKNESKFPVIIDETTQHTREFIYLLKELNEKDISMKDKKRMESYLSKSIVEINRKINDDVNNINNL